MKAIITAIGNTLIGTEAKLLEIEVQHQGLLEDAGLRAQVKHQLEHHFATTWQQPVEVQFDDELLAV